MLKSWFKLPVNKELLEAEIEKFEAKTNVEVKVVIENKAKLNNKVELNHFDYCHRLFNNLGMNDIKGHSLLFYISLQPKYCAIIGDDKIYNELGNSFDQYVSTLTSNLRIAIGKKDLSYAISQTLAQIKPDFLRFYTANFTSQIDNEVIINEN